MTSDDQRSDISRRDFVRWSGISGAALVLGVCREGRVVAPARGNNADAFVPNEWISIDTSGTVTIMVARAEMGQGVRTALPMIVAEELGANWSRVRVVTATPGAAFTDMRTSGSSSVGSAWRVLRPAAAAAREMLLTAAAATWGVDAESCRTASGEVLHPESGRTLAFGALVVPASQLPVPQSASLKPSSQFTLLGTRVKRVDAPLMVDGRAKYGLDTRLPGMRFAAVARPPRLGSVLEKMDDSRARGVRGVIDVVRISTGVAVIANRTIAALKGRDALALEWTRGRGGDSAAWLRDLEESLPQGRSARHEGGPTDDMLRASARQFTQTYVAPFQAHAAMEPLNCTVDLHDDQCTIWVGTQAPNDVQDAVAKQLGIPVTVHVPLLGGGFGRRLDVDYVREAVEIARAGTSPLQVVWTREDDLRNDMYQPGQVNRLSAGVDVSGLPTAWRHQVADYHLTMFGGFNANYDPATDGDPWGGIDTPYAFDSLDVTLSLLKSPVPTGAWRAVSYPAAVFARESFLDEIAHDTGRDPLALRLALLPSPGIVRAGSRDLPNGDRLRRVLHVAADRAGWNEPFATERAGRRWGRGIACNGYHQRTMVAQVAEVSVGRAGDVRVHRVVCAVDCGQVVNQLGIEGQFESGVLWALSAALKGEITFSDGRADQANFDTFPVMRMNEAPVVEVHIVKSDLPPFGVGEQPVPAVAPAVFNAIFAATGRRLRRTPARAEDLQSAGP